MDPQEALDREDDVQFVLDFSANLEREGELEQEIRLLSSKLDELKRKLQQLRFRMKDKLAGFKIRHRKTGRTK